MKSNLNEERLQRLDKLRKVQGSELEHYKDELMSELRLDNAKAEEFGKVDYNIYNV